MGLTLASFGCGKLLIIALPTKLGRDATDDVADVDARELGRLGSPESRLSPDSCSTTSSLVSVLLAGFSPFTPNDSLETGAYLVDEDPAVSAEDVDILEPGRPPLDDRADPFWAKKG